MSVKSITFLAIILALWTTGILTASGFEARVNIVTNSSSSNGGAYFDPSSLNIYYGTNITWSNNDSVIHSVVSGVPGSENSGINFNSGYIEPGDTFQRTVNSAGIFDYYCKLHPFMTGYALVSANKSVLG
jgi:plastocyanin